MKINKDISIETDLPKEIDKFKEPIFLNLKERHFVILILNVFIAGIMYYFFYQYKEVVTWLILIPIVIVSILGILKINGMYIEVLYKKLLRYKKGEKVKVDKLTQHYVLHDEIVQISKTCFAICMQIGDINYLLQDEAERETLYSKYAESLNALDENIKFKLVLNNKAYTEKDIEQVMIKKDKQGMNLKYVNELNDVMYKKTVGSNKKRKEMYMCLIMDNTTYEKAKFKFTSARKTLIRNFTDIRTNQEAGSKLTTLNANEAVNIINDLFLWTDDDDICFYKNHFVCNNKFYEILAIKDYGMGLNDNLLLELFTLNERFSVLLDITNPKRFEFKKLLKKQRTQLESRIYNWQKKEQSRKGIPVERDEAPLELSRELEAVLEVEEKVYTQNQRIFNLSMVFLIEADTLESLKLLRNEFNAILDNYQLDTSTLVLQQKEVLNMFYPNVVDEVYLKRFMLTENLANIIPFGVRTVATGGEYMGLNKVSGEILSLDRTKLKNANGFILGQSGSGKSVQAKLSILQTLLNSSEDEIIIIDPEREYRVLCDSLGGEVIEMSSKSTNYVNPLHITKEMCEEAHPVKLKSEMVLAFLENVLFRQLTSIEKSLVDRALRDVYNVWLNDGDIPTLVELSEVLSTYDEVEAKDLVVGIELYTKGALDIFANQSNIDYHNRFLCFDIHELGSQLKTVGIMVILEEIWKRVVENKGKRKTHVIIDEIHLLFKEESLVEFLLSVYKRIRKYGGVPTGITQDVEDLLDSKEARGMLANSEFIVMMGQSAQAQYSLQKLFNLSDEVVTYINNPDKGTGLIKYGGDVTPFDNVIDMDSEVFKLINTDNYAK